MNKQKWNEKLIKGLIKIVSFWRNINFKKTAES